MCTQTRTHTLWCACGHNHKPPSHEVTLVIHDVKVQISVGLYDLAVLYSRVSCVKCSELRSILDPSWISTSQAFPWICLRITIAEV